MLEQEGWQPGAYDVGQFLSESPCLYLLSVLLQSSSLPPSPFLSLFFVHSLSPPFTIHHVYRCAQHISYIAHALCLPCISIIPSHCLPLPSLFHLIFSLMSVYLFHIRIPHRKGTRNNFLLSDPFTVKV